MPSDNNGTTSRDNDMEECDEKKKTHRLCISSLVLCIYFHCQLSTFQFKSMEWIQATSQTIEIFHSKFSISEFFFIIEKEEPLQSWEPGWDWTN